MFAMLHEKYENASVICSVCFAKVPCSLPGLHCTIYFQAVFFCIFCIMDFNRNPPFFVHLFSFFCPVRPTLPHAIFFPKIPSFWDLRSTLSRREKATCRGWVLGTVLDGVAPQEKRKILFFWRAKKGEENSGQIILRNFANFASFLLGQTTILGEVIAVIHKSPMVPFELLELYFPILLLGKC